MILNIYGLIDQVNFECLRAHIFNELIVYGHLILLPDVVDGVATSGNGGSVLISVELEMEEWHHLFFVVDILWSLQVFAILDSD